MDIYCSCDSISWKSYQALLNHLFATSSPEKFHSKSRKSIFLRCRCRIQKQPVATSSKLIWQIIICLFVVMRTMHMYWMAINEWRKHFLPECSTISADDMNVFKINYIKWCSAVIFIEILMICRYSAQVL